MSSLETIYTPSTHSQKCRKYWTIDASCVTLTQKPQNKPSWLDLIRSCGVNYRCDRNNYSTHGPEPPTRMDLASYLTIRTLLFFKSLIGLADKLIKGDPQSRESWTLYYILTAIWKHVSLPPSLTTRGCSPNVCTHTCTHTHKQAGICAISAFILISSHLWPAAGWNRSSV